MNINIPVIFVSAYSDFDYAREALGYDVFGYLLKVVDINELKVMMCSLKDKLDADKKNDINDVEQYRECFIENLCM
jgi:two-component system response regulator YesN